MVIALRIAAVALVLSVPVAAVAQDTGASDEAKQDRSVWKRMFGGAPRTSSDETVEVEAGSTEGSRRYSRDVRQMQARLRKTQAASDPEFRRYMELVDSGLAGSSELGAFANLAAGHGFLEIAEVYLREALRFDEANALLWTNLGTIQRQAGKLDAAIGSYKRALDIDPGLAIAHYNLGAAFDAKDSYDAAIESYVRAFTIDADLADPRTNPQVVNNSNLAAASLILYQRQAGSRTLPLIAIPSAPADE